MVASNNIFNKILENRVLTHLLFWLLALLIFPLYAIGFQRFSVSLLLKAFYLPIQILAFYYLVYYQVPKYLYRKKYLYFFVLMLLAAVVFCTLTRLMEEYLLVPTLNYLYPKSNTPTYEPKAYIEILSNPFVNIFRSGIGIYVTVFIAAAVKFLKMRYEEKQRLALLQKEKNQAEINFLKAQINPRILSKTLHQLHILTKEKSDAAPEVVIKLSDMLDYMLYQCSEPKVLIIKEIELIQNYLDLEKLRFGAGLTIHFYHELENNFAKISPLLLLSLIERAFIDKKEVLPTDAQIEILLKQKEDRLTLQIFSNLAIAKNKEERNIKKQLDLLYPNQHQLEVNDKKDGFTLNLALQSECQNIIKPQDLNK